MEINILLIAGLIGSILFLYGSLLHQEMSSDVQNLRKHNPDLKSLNCPSTTDRIFYKTLTRIYMTTFLSVVFPILFVLMLKEVDIHSYQRSLLIKDRILSLILVPIIALLLIVVCMARSTSGTNSTPPARAHILLQFVSTVGTITWGFCLGDLLKIIDGHKALARKQVMIPFFILVLGLVLPGPYFSFRRTSVLVTPLMREYPTCWDSRNNMIQNEIAERNLNPSVKPLPHLTGLPAMDEDPENWINNCEAELYGLNSIVAEDISQ